MSRRRGRYDLHIHTDCSDGTDPVAVVVERVVSAELAGFSITDHDTIAAQSEAAQRAADAGIDYVYGLELSVAEGDHDIHLLVYGYDPDHDELNEWLGRFRQARRERALGMVKRLKEHGIDLDAHLLLAERDAVGRPHVARAMVDAGAVRTIREAFDRYLGVGRPAYLPKYKISPADGIEVAQRAGGAVVLAHPASYPFRIDLAGLVRDGLQGIETTYPFWNHSTTAHWRSQAKAHGLLETGGSDYHGAIRPQVDVGDATIDRTMFERLLTSGG